MPTPPSLSHFLHACINTHAYIHTHAYTHAYTHAHLCTQRGKYSCIETQQYCIARNIGGWLPYANVLADLILVVRYGIIIHIYEILADFNLAVARADCQIANFNSFQLYDVPKLSFDS